MVLTHSRQMSVMTEPVLLASAHIHQRSAMMVLTVRSQQVLVRSQPSCGMTAQRPEPKPEQSRPCCVTG